MEWLYKTNCKDCSSRVLTFSDFDTDAGQLLEILGRKNLDYQQNIQKKLGFKYRSHSKGQEYNSLLHQWITKPQRFPLIYILEGHSVKRLALGDTFGAVYLSVSWWPAVLCWLWPVESDLCFRPTKIQATTWGTPRTNLKFDFPTQIISKKLSCYGGTTLWSSLPCKARCAESLGLFKRAISKALQHTAFMDGKQLNS